ncbi:MAG: hypothetical protein RLZZ499_2785, partial [Cyanobacteriota bacterium]
CRHSTKSLWFISFTSTHPRFSVCHLLRNVCGCPGKALHPELFIKPLLSRADLVVEIKSDRSLGRIYRLEQRILLCWEQRFSNSLESYSHD